MLFITPFGGTRLEISVLTSKQWRGKEFRLWCSKHENITFLKIQQQRGLSRRNVLVPLDVPHREQLALGLLSTTF